MARTRGGKVDVPIRRSSRRKTASGEEDDVPPEIGDDNDRETTIPPESENVRNAAEAKAVAKPKDPEAVAKPTEPEAAANPKEPEVVAKPKEPEVVANPKEPEAVAKPTEPEAAASPGSSARLKSGTTRKSMRLATTSPEKESRTSVQKVGPTRWSLRLANSSPEKDKSTRRVESDGKTNSVAVPESSRKRKKQKQKVNNDDDVEVVEVVPQPKQKVKKKKRKTSSAEEIEEDRQEVSDDDCPVAEDEDCDEVRFDENNGGGGIGLQEEECEDFVAEFGENAREEVNGDDSDADSGDEIWEEERIPEPISHSDDEEDVDAEGVVPRETEDPEELLRLGKTFNSTQDFKIAVLRYSLKTRYDIKLYRSQSLKIGAKCSDTEGKCAWRCYCSYDRKKHKMQVKIYQDEHCCVRSGYSKMLKQSSIAWLFSERLRKNPKITKLEMVEEIKREYNMTVTEDQCAKAKSTVLRSRKAIHEDHFARIWDYQAEIFRTNPGTSFEIETIPGPTIGSLQRFFRLFICFKAQIVSWKETCRPIIGIDGAFLKWDVKGHLLAATGRDGDNRIVPIAWAVVEIENDDNWDWFIKMLSSKLELGGGKQIAIISDKQSGLVKAIHTVLPEAEHRQCARHIMDNWKRNSHDMELQRLFWKIARSYTEGDFIGHMQELNSYNKSAYDSLLKTNPRTWSRAFFRIGSCCNDNLNNLSESFNRTIRQARKKPLLDMLEDIRRQCMVRNVKRYVVAGRLKTRFTKRAHAEIEKMIAGSQFCERWMARHNKYEVKLGNNTVSVDMNDRTCGCRKWQMTGIPCVHAASVIIGMKHKVEDYVSDWYTTEKWRQTYFDGIGPVQSMHLWPRMNRLGVLPPPWRRANPGRPKNHDRRKGVFEQNTKLSRMNRVMTCSNCKQEGHNKQGCQNQKVQTPPKKPRGRPRKDQEPRNILFGQGQPLQPSEPLSQTQPSHGQPTEPLSQPLSQGAPSEPQSQQSSQQSTQPPSHQQSQQSSQQSTQPPSHQPFRPPSQQSTQPPSHQPFRPPSQQPTDRAHRVGGTQRGAASQGGGGSQTETSIYRHWGSWFGL